MYDLNLPLPPSTNDYYGTHTKFGHATVYIKQKGKEYRKQVLDYVVKNNLQLQANTILELDIIFTPKTKHRQDVDNVLKSLLDSLTHAKVYDDDSLIYKLAIEKRAPNKEKPGLQIKISPFEIKQ